MTVRHGAYSAAVPAAFEDVVRSLPATLQRSDIDAYAISVRGQPQELEAVFIASQIWGYGDTGYGPTRLAESLSYPRLVDALAASLEELRRGRAGAAYEALVVRHRIPRCGTAFGSKALRFLHPPAGAQILDGLIARWLKRESELTFYPRRDRTQYERFLSSLAVWSASLGHPAERLEILMFADEARRGRTWQTDSDFWE